MSNNTHGMSRTPEYKAWKNMKDRCFNPNHKNYSHYGGRGIAVCDRWLNLDNFLTDMGIKPTPKHSLDRIDNDGDYCLENCRWATRAEQQNNLRSNKPLITIDGKTLTIAQWAKKMGFSANVIHNRLKAGWSEYKAVMTPVKQYKKTFRCVIVNEFDAVMTPVRYKRKSA